MENKIIFLDFDGVLFDSAKESYLLARYVFDSISPFNPIDNIDYAKYMENRYLVSNSWQYYYLMLLLRDISVKDSTELKEKYLQLISNRDINADNEFDKKFQGMRKTLINEHYEFWKSLEMPFPFFHELKKLNITKNIIIVSTKNKEAIIKKCKEYNFNLINDNIIGKEILKGYKSKHEFIEKFMKENSINKAIFVEDNEDNLNSCRNISNLKLCLAKWGYVSPNANGQSEEDIIKLIQEEIICTTTK